MLKLLRSVFVSFWSFPNLNLHFLCCVPKGTEKTEIRYQQQHFFFRAHMEPTKSRKSLLHFCSYTNCACSHMVVTLIGTSGTANFWDCRSYFIFDISCCYLDSWALHRQPGSGYSRINFSQTVIGHLGPSQVTESMKCSFTCSNFERDTLYVVKLRSGWVPNTPPGPGRGPLADLPLSGTENASISFFDGDFALRVSRDFLESVRYDVFPFYGP